MNAFAPLLASARRERRPLLVGVLNVTPDSFSDGGAYVDSAAWRERVDTLLREGADVIDIGGESTRPGSVAVDAPEQIRRLLGPITYAAKERRACVSVDTTHPDVAARALEAGASLVNDVSCLADPRLAAVAQQHQAFLWLMHSRGAMGTMAGFSAMPATAYGDVVADVQRELGAACHRARAAGVPLDRLLIDPGLGFHKNADQSYAVLRNLHMFAALGAPVLVGPSRKSFLARDVPSSPGERLGGTIAACLVAAQQGAIGLRVHDVLAVRQALAVARVLREEGGARGLP